MPQQSDLISKFVKLSIRRGSSLASLSKSPDHLRIVVDTFRATARDPLDPDEEDAKKFLAEAGNWITDTAQNLLEVSASSIEQIVRFPLSELTSAVEAFREEIRQKRKHKALSREEEVRLSRIDRSRDEYFMREALVEAEKAHQAGEVPVGAVVVDKEGKIIGRGHNLVVAGHDPSGHAEIIALKNASQNLKNYRLDNCTIYVTLEPCPMCAGAIINSRIEKVYFGAYDKKSGCAGSVINLFESGMFNHNVNVTGGITEDKCASILTEFFRELRKKK